MASNSTGGGRPSYDPESKSMMSRAMAALFEDDSPSPAQPSSRSGSKGVGGSGGRDKRPRREEGSGDEEGDERKPKDHKKWQWVERDENASPSFADGPALQPKEQCVFCAAGEKRCRGGDRTLGRKCEGCERGGMECSILDPQASSSSSSSKPTANPSLSRSNSASSFSQQPSGSTSRNNPNIGDQKVRSHKSRCAVCKRNGQSGKECAGMGGRDERCPLFGKEEVEKQQSSSKGGPSSFSRTVSGSNSPHPQSQPQPERVKRPFRRERSNDDESDDQKDREKRREREREEKRARISLGGAAGGSGSQAPPPPSNNVDANRNLYSSSSSNYNVPPPPPPPAPQPQPAPAPPLAAAAAAVASGGDSALLTILGLLRTSDLALAQAQSTAASLQTDNARLVAEKATLSQEKGALETQVGELEEKVKEGKSALEKKEKVLRGTIGKGVQALNKANDFETKNAALQLQLNQTKQELAQMETLLASGGDSNSNGSGSGGGAGGRGGAGGNVKQEPGGEEDGFGRGGMGEDPRDRELKELREENARLQSVNLASSQEKDALEHRAKTYKDTLYKVRDSHKELMELHSRCPPTTTMGGEVGGGAGERVVAGWGERERVGESTGQEWLTGLNAPRGGSGRQ